MSAGDFNRRVREGAGRSPELSAVVPTIPRRAHYLERCLTSLAGARARDRLEVLVVTEEPERIEALVREWRPAVDVRVVEGPGPAARKRNAGVQAARANVIAFLDDDTEVEDGWAEAFLRAFANGVEAAAGRVVPSFEAPLPDHLAQNVELVRGFNALGEWRRAGFVIGCNVAFRRTVFEEVGLFSPDFGRSGDRYQTGDETEFVARVRRSYPVAYVEDAGVLHAIQPRRLERGYLYARSLLGGRANASIDRRHRRDFVRNAWSVALLLPILVVRALRRPRDIAPRVQVLSGLSYVTEAVRLALTGASKPGEIPRID